MPHKGKNPKKCFVSGIAKRGTRLKILSDKYGFERQSSEMLNVTATIDLGQRALNNEDQTITKTSCVYCVMCMCNKVVLHFSGCFVTPADKFKQSLTESFWLTFAKASLRIYPTAPLII